MLLYSDSHNLQQVTVHAHLVQSTSCYVLFFHQTPTLSVWPLVATVLVAFVFCCFFGPLISTQPIGP